jgi:hypothetical protein
MLLSAPSVQSVCFFPVSRLKNIPTRFVILDLCQEKRVFAAKKRRNPLLCAKTAVYLHCQKVKEKLVFNRKVSKEDFLG